MNERTMLERVAKMTRDGYTLDEIAVSLRCTVRTVSRWRARAKVRSGKTVRKK